MAVKRSVIVRGTPVVNEDGAATAQVKPGYLVELGAALSIKHCDNTRGGNEPRTFALERDELGTGIDDTYQGEGTGSAFYASGDTVKVAACAPGDEVTAFVASGYGVAVGDFMMHNGDGTLVPLEGTNSRLAVALDAVTGSTSVTACRVRVM